jgi:hypothetical protein
MPATGSGPSGGDRGPDLSLWQRTLLRLPRLGGRADKAPLKDRLERTFLKPVDPAKAQKRPSPPRPEDHQLANNPAARLASGRPNPAHVSTALAHELELVLIALAVVILVTSLVRRRLYTGIATALYGLAIFNLHWWGFGIPFVLVGSWFLVRAYRAQQAYKTATGGTGGGRAAGGVPPPGANKRYTPPAATPAERRGAGEPATAQSPPLPSRRAPPAGRTPRPRRAHRTARPGRPEALGRRRW